jgi:hypothetical protein
MSDERAKLIALRDTLAGLPCPYCDKPLATCHCTPLPHTPARHMRTNATLRKPTPQQAQPKPMYASESHRALACRHCGYISCRCTIPAPPSTLDEVLRIQQART